MSPIMIHSALFIDFILQPCHEGNETCADQCPYSHRVIHGERLRKVVLMVDVMLHPNSPQLLVVWDI